MFSFDDKFSAKNSWNVNFFKQSGTFYNFLRKLCKQPALQNALHKAVMMRSSVVCVVLLIRQRYPHL